MDKVKQLIAAGAPVAGAIKLALGMPLSEFADKYGIPRTSVANHVNSNVKPSEATIAALVSELGGTPEEWAELLWQAMRPAHLAAS